MVNGINDAEEFGQDDSSLKACLALFNEMKFRLIKI